MVRSFPGQTGDGAYSTLAFHKRKITLYEERARELS